MKELRELDLLYLEESCPQQREFLRQEHPDMLEKLEVQVTGQRGEWAGGKP